MTDDPTSRAIDRALHVKPISKTPAGLIKGKQQWLHHDKPGGKAAQRRLRQRAK